MTIGLRNPRRLPCEATPRATARTIRPHCANAPWQSSQNSHELKTNSEKDLFVEPSNKLDALWCLCLEAEFRRSYPLLSQLLEVKCGEMLQRRSAL